MTLPTQSQLRPKTSTRDSSTTTVSYSTEPRYLDYQELRGYGKNITFVEKQINIVRKDIAQDLGRAQRAEERGNKKLADEFRARAAARQARIDNELAPQLSNYQNELGSEAYNAARQAAPKQYVSGKQGASSAENASIRKAVSVNYAVTQANAKRDSLSNANFSGSDGEIYVVQQPAINGVNFSSKDSAQQTPLASQLRGTFSSSFSNESNSGSSANKPYVGVTKNNINVLVKGRDNQYVISRAEGIARRDEAARQRQEAAFKQLEKNVPVVGPLLFSPSNPTDGRIKRYAKTVGQGVYLTTFGFAAPGPQLLFDTAQRATDKAVFRYELETLYVRGKLSSRQRQALFATREDSKRAASQVYTTPEGLGTVTVGVATVATLGALSARSEPIAVNTPRTLEVEGSFSYPKTTTTSSSRGTGKVSTGIDSTKETPNIGFALDEMARRTVGDTTRSRPTTPRPQPEVQVTYSLPLRGGLNTFAGRTATVVSRSDALGVTTTTSVPGFVIRGPGNIRLRLLKDMKTVDVRPATGSATRAFYRGGELVRVTELRPQPRGVALVAAESVANRKTPLPQSPTVVEGTGTSRLFIEQVKGTDFTISGTVNGLKVRGIGLSQTKSQAEVVAANNRVTLERTAASRPEGVKGRQPMSVLSASKSKSTPQVLELGSEGSAAVETMTSQPKAFYDADAGAVGVEFTTGTLQRGPLRQSVVTESSGRFKILIGKQPRTPRLSQSQRTMLELSRRAEKNAKVVLGDESGAQQRSVSVTKTKSDTVTNLATKTTKVQPPEVNPPTVSLRSLTEVLPKTSVRSGSKFLPVVVGSLSGASRLSAAPLTRRTTPVTRPIIEPPATTPSTRYQFDVDIRQPPTTTPDIITTTRPFTPVPTNPLIPFPEFPRTPVPKTPFVPIVGFPSIPGASGFKFPKGKSRANQRKAYTPSAFAVALGIKGKKPGRGAITSGLGIRPILK